MCIVAHTVSCAFLIRFPLNVVFLRSCLPSVRPSRPIIYKYANELYDQPGHKYNVSDVRKCHYYYQGRQIKNTSGRTKGHQRERVLFPSTRESNPECIYHDGGTILRPRGTTEAGQGGTRSLPDDKMEYGETKVGTHKHYKGSTGRETTPRQIYQRVREFPNEALCERTTAVLQLSEVLPPGQDLQVRYPDLHVLRWKTRTEPVQGQQKSHTKVRKLSTGACHHQSALPKETGSREQSKDFAHTSTQNAYNQTSQQKPSPHSIEKLIDLH